MIFRKRKIKNWEVALQLVLSATMVFILLYLLFTTKKWYWFPFSQLPILLIINFGIFDKIIINKESISEKRLFSTKTLFYKDIKQIGLMSSNKSVGFIKEADLNHSFYGVQIYVTSYENLSPSIYIEDNGKPIIFDFNKEAWEHLKINQNTSDAIKRGELAASNSKPNFS